MFKNQKTYFSKPNIPPEVIEKTMIKMNKPKSKKQIKKDKKVSKPDKSIKQQNIDKLMKTYGKNNNMISLLIYLLKNKDQNKRQYKTKSTYRAGYKKGNSYQTKSQITTQRKNEVKTEKDKKVRSDLTKLVVEADKSKLKGDTGKEAELLKQVNTTLKKYLTEEDYENFGKFLTPEQRKNKLFLEGLKKSTEEKIIQAEEDRKTLLKDKQTAGRKIAEVTKEKEMNEYISGLLFEEKQTQSDFNKIFDDFKQQGKSPPTAYSKSKFMSLLKPKYKIDLEDSIKLEDIEKQKKREEFLKQGLIGDFWKDKIYETQPNRNEIKRIRKEYQQLFGESLSGEDIIKNIKIQPKEPEAPEPPPEEPTPPDKPPPKKGRKRKDIKIAEGIEAVITAGGNDLKGIDLQIGALEKYIIKEDRTKLIKLKKKTHLSETEQKELDGIEKMIQEVNDRKDILRQRKDILKSYLDQDLLPKDYPNLEDYLPDPTDDSISNDDYTAELEVLKGQLEQIPDDDNDTEEEED